MTVGNIPRSGVNDRYDARSRLCAMKREPRPGRESITPRCVLALAGPQCREVATCLAARGVDAALYTPVFLSDLRDLTGWLGREPAYDCAETVLSMAVTAFQQAGSAQSDTAQEHVLGVGCVLPSAVNHPFEEGDEKCWAAVQTRSATRLYSLSLETAANESPDPIADLLQHALVEASTTGVQTPNDAAALGNVRTVTEHADPLLADVWQGRTPIIWSMPEAGLSPAPHVEPSGVLCGAFNPLHEGHLAMRAAAECRLQGCVHFELSVANADKLPLDYLTIARRYRQFAEHTLALTNAATFAAKAEILPQTTFVVGADTAERVVEARFYGSSNAEMRGALDGIRDAGCRFLVAGRSSGGTFRILDDLPIPNGYADLFEELPAEEFRWDISSTRLRGASRETRRQNRDST